MITITVSFDYEDFTRFWNSPVGQRIEELITHPSCDGWSGKKEGEK